VFLIVERTAEIAHPAQPIEIDAYRHRGIIILVASIGGLLLISWIFAHWDLDRGISARFYRPADGWYLEKARPWYWFYRYGTIPGILLTLTSLGGYVVTRLRRPESDWHRYFLLVLLTSLLGAGFLVNSVLKPYWGRPRPDQIQEFGGQYTYRHALNPGIPGKGKSFTCGHCTMGFLFVVLVYFRRRSTTVAILGGLGGLTYGGLVSVTRVIQGAHFVTDCIWSLGVLWLVATVLYYFILKIPAQPAKDPRSLLAKHKRRVVLLATVCAVGIVLAFLTRRPYYETGYFYPQLTQDVREIHVALDCGAVKHTVRYSETAPLQILIHSRGFAWIGAADTKAVKSEIMSGPLYQVVYKTEKRGYFSELIYEIEVVIPSSEKNRLTVVFTGTAGQAHD
jgi:membrane-associated PAP2 superfamily phosphatase